MTDWQSALEAVAAEYTRGTLERDARAISEAYRLKTGEGKRLLTRESEAAAYALSRMPATVEAARAALGEALEASGLAPRTMLDCGAGTGAVTFAADSLLALERATCLEREAAMRAVGQRLMAEAGGVQAQWAACDLTAREPLPRAQARLRGVYARRAGSLHAPAGGGKALERLRADARPHRAGHAAGLCEPARRSGRIWPRWAHMSPRRARRGAKPAR